LKLPEPRPGLVIRYGFLWSHEAEAGAEEAAKDRPCAIVVAARRQENGEIGVKAVDGEGRVAFHAVSIVDTDNQGIWITGLPEEITLITVGQEYVSAGEAVRAVQESEIEESLEDLS
jgi:hypothetical protein